MVEATGPPFHFKDGPGAESPGLTSIHRALAEDHKETALWPDWAAAKQRLHSQAKDVSV
jgi:hypothetical protein